MKKNKRNKENAIEAEFEVKEEKKEKKEKKARRKMSLPMRIIIGLVAIIIGLIGWVIRLITGKSDEDSNLGESISTAAETLSEGITTETE